MHAEYALALGARPSDMTGRQAATYSYSEASALGARAPYAAVHR